MAALAVGSAACQSSQAMQQVAERWSGIDKIPPFRGVTMRADPGAVPDSARPMLLRMRITYAAFDSVVMERSSCLIDCPAYRVRIRGDGDVSFVSRDERFGEGRTHHGKIVRDLLDLGIALYWNRFDLMPDTIAKVPVYCPGTVSDAITVTTRLYIGTWSKHVVNYHGCTWSPVGLHQIERMVNEVGGTTRWDKRIARDRQ